MHRQKTAEMLYAWIGNHIIIPAFLWMGILMIVGGVVLGIADPRYAGVPFGGFVSIIGWIVFRKIAR